MELQYLELLEEHNLKLSEIPDDAKTGIDNIKAIVNSIGVAEKKGNRVNAQTFKRLAALDKWVCYEILDYVNDTDKNKKPMPNAEVVIDGKEPKSEPEPNSEGDSSLGFEIEAELESMSESGVDVISFSDLKSSAPKCYNLLFDTYEENGENGIETTKYKLVEVEEEKFKLSKK
jgi:hypothetical protein